MQYLIKVSVTVTTVISIITLPNMAVQFLMQETLPLHIASLKKIMPAKKVMISARWIRVFTHIKMMNITGDSAPRTVLNG